MKYPATFFTRTGLPLRRKKIEEQPEPEANLGPRPPTEKELREAPLATKYQPLDSWEPRHRLSGEMLSLDPSPAKGTPVVQEETLNGEIEGPEIPTTPREMKNKKKIRTNTMGISVSLEERDLLRRHAASKGLTFSEWARSVLFRAMGRKVPSRPKKDWED